MNLRFKTQHFLSFFLLSLIIKNISSQKVGGGGREKADAAPPPPPWLLRAPAALFHKSWSSQTQQMKSIRKIKISFLTFTIFLLRSTFFYGVRQKSKYNYIKQLTLFLLLFFQIPFLWILLCSSFFVFCILSNKLDSISCDICLSFKASIQSCSVKLLFSYPPHVYFQVYG